jgi:NTP pyrophosphatase (non-canonical NTP hydrolase)
LIKILTFVKVLNIDKGYHHSLFTIHHSPLTIKPMNLKNAQLDVDTWIKQHGVRYFNELTNMAQLTEEVGEVARIIARRYGEQSEKESDKNKDLGEELADVVFVVLCLANQTGIDLQAAFDKKMDLKSIRDKDRHKNNDKLK